MSALGIWAALAGCGALATPAQQAAKEADDVAASLTAHLQALPHVVAASVMVRARHDAPVLLPSASPSCQWNVSAILTLDSAADAAGITQATRNHLGAVLPESCPPTITALPREPRTSQAPAKVGPFEVGAASKRPLQLTLGALLLLIAWLLMRLRAQRAWSA